MVRLLSWLLVAVAFAGMQLPWVRCVDETHEHMHVDLGACACEHEHDGHEHEHEHEHERADHEPLLWDAVFTPAAHLSTPPLACTVASGPESTPTARAVNVPDPAPRVTPPRAALRSTVLLL